jgi:hypothetical protein
MPYQVTESIKNRARILGIEVKSSKNAKKKLDAYKDGIFQASFGATGYDDYHSYRKKEGAHIAEQKKEQYKSRHQKDRNVKYRNGKLTAGWLADKVLWT